MKFCLGIALILVTVIAFRFQDTCLYAQGIDWEYKRVVNIQGKASIINHPTLGLTPASSETLIFQKVGCTSCYIAAKVDLEGRYKILVGDGKYKLIVRNPSSPEFDMVAPDQERFIDTETEAAKMYSKQVFDFDIKIRLPK